MVGLVEREDCDAIVVQFLNRLSDWLFVAARKAAAITGNRERTYQKPKPTDFASDAVASTVARFV